VRQGGGLYEAPVKPIYIGHSFGGSQVFYSAVKHPERMRGALLLDTGFGGPPTREQEEQWRREAEKPATAGAGRCSARGRTGSMRPWRRR
jgi:pimeloyl-ACP methyl ester carboxylesterase